MTDRRTVFDSIPEQFDRWRPRYCSALFDRIIREVPLTERSKCLEIGPGTGQATEFALDLGCDYTAIELGARFVGFMREKYGHRANFHIIHGDFEKEPLTCDAFDLVYSAAAIQWIDEEIAFGKSFDLLKPGGCLAMFMTRGSYQETNPALHDAIQRVYDLYFHSDQPYTQKFHYDRACEFGFRSEERLVFPGERVYSADEYVQYIGTHSDHIALRPECREPFYRGIRDAILDFGGTITLKDDIVLYLCRK